MIDINTLTIGEATELASKLSAFFGTSVGKLAAPPCGAATAPAPVIVCTDKRGVFFGYCVDVNARPIVLTDARMCIYWSTDVGGVLGLGDIGPTKDCKISATAGVLRLEGVTSVYSVSSKAETAWKKAPVQGR